MPGHGVGHPHLRRGEVVPQRVALLDEDLQPIGCGGDLLIEVGHVRIGRHPVRWDGCDEHGH